MGRLREQPWLLLVVFLIGAGVAAFGTYADRWIGEGWSADEVIFADRPQTLLWLALSIAAGGVWAALGVIAGVLFSQTRGGSPLGIGAGLVLAAALLFGVVELGTTIEPQHPLPEREAKLRYFTAFGVAATMPCVATIWVVHQMAASLRPVIGRDGWQLELSEGVGGTPRPAAVHPIAALMRLRELLDRALVLLGAMLGIAIASIGAFRNAVVSWKECDVRRAPGLEDPCGREAFSASSGADFLGAPIEYVLLHGMCFSLLLALIYVPAYLRLQALGRTVVEQLIPIDSRAGAKTAGSAAPGAVADLLDERQSLLTVLQLNAGVLSSLTAGASILTPLIASFAGLLLSTS